MFVLAKRPSVKVDLRRQDISRPCGFHRGGHRHSFKFATSGKRDGKLRESGAEIPVKIVLDPIPGQQYSASGMNAEATIITR